jgi:TolB-like protein
MARFLEFAVEETLHGRGNEIKENVIGIHVFDRPSTYDPRVDPIVRVEARRLRVKLRAYYEREGKADELIIELPKGRYSPVFRRRSAEVSEASIQPETIAVLPFANLGAASGTDFLSDGLTEDLISALTRVSNLRVSAWTSASMMKGDQDNLQMIRELLHVTFVVRGSIRKTHDRIRIVTHLIEPSSKQYIWSQTFDRKFQDIFAVQDEITNAIVAALRAKLTNIRVAESASLETRQNLESYQLCLKGRFHARERTSEGLRRSALCFQQATEIDATSASAYAGLAETLALQAEYAFEDGPAGMEKAKAAAERALALNPASAEAQASYGLILASYDWAWDRAEASFRQSLELNDSYAPTHHWYSMNHLAMLGRFSEAEAEIEVAITLDPLSPITLEGRAYLRFLRREYSQSIALYKEIICADPSFYKGYASAGRTYLQMGESALAIEMIEKGLALAGELPSVFGMLGHAYGVAGDRQTALRILEKLKQISATRPVFSTSFAFVHLGLGEEQTALDWLERAVNRREPNIVALAVHPAYDQLRQNPRFKMLVDRIFPCHN